MYLKRVVQTISENILRILIKEFLLKNNSDAKLLQ